MAFVDNLQQASWRGLPFAVETESKTVGRRIARHDYPGRDRAWPEDQGQLPEEFRISGFLISNSTIYGGGDVQSQRRAMEAAANQGGTGALGHPMQGVVSGLTCNSLVTSTRVEDGVEIVELQFYFIQGATQTFPSILSDLAGVLGKATALADAVGLGSFASKVLVPLQNGVTAVTSMASAAQEWAGKIDSLGRDATGLYGTLSQLGGGAFGRYFNGGNSGFLQGLSSAYSSATSISDLLNLGASRRSDVASASAAVQAAIGAVSGGADATAVGASVQASVAALSAAIADPADGVRIMGALAQFQPINPASKQAAGAAISDLFRQSAGTAIAGISGGYAPSSSDDAKAVLAKVLAPIQQVIDQAGDSGDDAVFSAFRTIRKAVISDLGARGAALPGLVSLTSATALPSVVLAQARYADGDRADQLVTQADPIHPWFMPTVFPALAA